VKSAKPVQLVRKLAPLAEESLAGSKRLAEGLAAVRQEIPVVRGRTAECRDEVNFWGYVAAITNTVVCLWSELGQLCLIGWGRRRISNRVPAIS